LADDKTPARAYNKQNVLVTIKLSYQSLLVWTDLYTTCRVYIYILAVLAFSENQTHNVGTASTMLYCLSFKKAQYK